MASLTNHWQPQLLQKGNLSLHLLPTGDVFKWMDGDHQINLLQGNPLDGMIANLYLREKLATGYRVTKLMGVHAPGTWQSTTEGANYTGTVWDVTYQVHLILTETGWQYLLHLKGSNPDAVYDVMYGQDVGIANPFGILANEAYTAQYIDHQVFKTPDGFTLLSRQNQGNPHYVQMGSTFPTVAYATDAMQFFGLTYKQTHEPIAYQLTQLPSKNYQYEFAYLTLQTQTFQLTSKVLSMTFYMISQRNPTSFFTSPLPVPSLQTRGWLSMEGKTIKPLLNPNHMLAGKPLTMKTIQSLYPDLQQVESKDETFLSGFLPDGRHVVSQQKELLVERPHGHILLSGDVLHASEDVFATTAYMMGVFGSHTVYGNTNFHKLTGDVRHPLNFHTLAGTRLYLQTQGVYHLLGLPSLMVMGLDHVTWRYVLADDELTITLKVNGRDPLSTLSFESKQHKPYDLILTQQFLLDTNEYQHEIEYTLDGQAIVIDGRSSGMIKDYYPGLRYQLMVNQPYQLLTGRDLLPSLTSDGGMMGLQLKQVSKFEFYTQATLSGTFASLQDGIKNASGYPTMIKQLMPLTLNHPQLQNQLDAFNHLVPWYVHDALVHYASPHGLEQYNGAAWGTRDVLQGPFELFLTTQRFDITKEILLKVFARQFVDTKEFPQWFMFDHYRHIQAHESHGDVTVWPLKALANYLEATGDVTILDTPIPYMDKHTGKFTTDKVPLRDHLEAIFQVLKASAISGTVLPAYGGGDWDDTLQPANATLTKQMVSGWTVALLYEALTGLSQFSIFPDARQEAMLTYKEELAKDFHQHLIVDGVPAGFVIFYPNHHEVLLHPQDNKTGLTYRLLPFNRGMISQLFQPQDLPKYQQIIRQHLRHPDGVRLMNTAVQYQGGKKTYFQRAETAANFGREIGIQYVHAHIRYIEAMTTIGDAEEAWWGLQVINPISMQQVVPHAAYRQRNVYFSSSDAAFLDRYEAKRDFEKVRKGLLPVKAGWRLYSSGPGIYLQTLIQRFLGIRVKQGQLFIDPQLPSQFAGMTVHYHFQGKPLTMKIPNAIKKQTTENRYRQQVLAEVSINQDQVNVILKS